MLKPLSSLRADPDRAERVRKQAEYLRSPAGQRESAIKESLLRLRYLLKDLNVISIPDSRFDSNVLIEKYGNTNTSNSKTSR